MWTRPFLLSLLASLNPIIICYFTRSSSLQLGLYMFKCYSITLLIIQLPLFSAILTHKQVTPAISHSNWAPINTLKILYIQWALQPLALPGSHLHFVFLPLCTWLCALLNSSCYGRWESAPVLSHRLLCFPIGFWGAHCETRMLSVLCAVPTSFLSLCLLSIRVPSPFGLNLYNHQEEQHKTKVWWCHFSSLWSQFACSEKTDEQAVLAARRRSSSRARRHKDMAVCPLQRCWQVTNNAWVCCSAILTLYHANERECCCSAQCLTL